MITIAGSVAGSSRAGDRKHGEQVCGHSPTLVFHALANVSDELRSSILRQLLDSGLRREVGCVALCGERDLERSARRRRFIEHTGCPYGRRKIVPDEVRVHRRGIEACADGCPVVLHFPPEPVGGLGNDPRGCEDHEMSARAQHSSCLDETDVPVDPVKGIARKDGVEAGGAGIPGLERCRHDADIRKGRQVRPRPLGKMRAEFYRDDLQSACCKVSRGLARPRSDLHDRRPGAQRCPLHDLVEHVVGCHGSRTVVRLRVLIKCRPQHVSLIALPRWCDVAIRRHILWPVRVRNPAHLPMLSFARLIRRPHSQASRFWSHRRRPPRNAGSRARGSAAMSRAVVLIW